MQSLRHTTAISGFMAAKKAVPDTDHVARFVPANKQDRDPDTDEYRGLLPTSFAIRDGDEGGLSVTWIEFFGGLTPGSKIAAACAFRESLPSKKLPSKGVFAYGRVLDVKATAQQYRKQVRVVHAPVDGNDGYAEIRHFTDEDLELLDIFRSDVFTHVDKVADMQIPPRV